MTPKANKYLENPSPKAFAKLTTEEQRFVKRQEPKKPKAAPAADTKKPKGK